MRDFLLVFLLLFSMSANAGSASSARNSSAPSLEGKWLGFCMPNATAGTSSMCSYSFKIGSGSYQCDYFKDLRCATKDAKSTTASFRYSLRGGTPKTGPATVNIDYEDRTDIKQEKSRVFITGEVLRLQVYEVLRLPAEHDEKLDSQGVVPFFEFTKVKP